MWQESITLESNLTVHVSVPDKYKGAEFKYSEGEAVTPLNHACFSDVRSIESTEWSDMDDMATSQDKPTDEAISPTRC
jgi:hypothetical protein